MSINWEAMVVKGKLITGMMVIVLAVGFGCGSAVDEATPPGGDEPRDVVDQVTLGGSTLTVEELFFSGDDLAVVVTLHNQPGWDPRVMMPWHLEDEKGNVYSSQYTEMQVDEEGESGISRRLTVYFPDPPQEWDTLALEARIRHENWQVAENGEGTLAFTLEVKTDGPSATQTLGGLTAQAAAGLAEGALHVDVNLSVMSVDFWEALRQPVLRVVDGEGEEYVPHQSHSITEPVGPGEEPVSSSVHWHYTINDWPAEREDVTLYYELKGSVAPPETQAARFSGLTLSPVE